jgi:diguanylate cyclase (GGDEF)-like protein
MRQRRFTLSAKLLASFAGMGLLVLALLLLGEWFLVQSVARLEAVMTQQVRPLAQLNRLQAEASRIRVLEVELPRLRDLFAMSGQIELLESKVRGFDAELGSYLRDPQAIQGPLAAELKEGWARYRQDLERLAPLARAMDLEAVYRVGSYESAVRYSALSRALKQVTDETEKLADTAISAGRFDQSQQRRWFLATSLGGLLLLAVWLALLRRHISSRLEHLARGAAQLAGGRADQPIPVHGTDELAELATAFNTMQREVAERQASLRAAQQELEQRVKARTLELASTNQALLKEVDVRRQTEVQLQRQASFDALTGLPNRMLAMDRLEQALRDARRDGHRLALVFIDLDDFKKVNDNLGHSAGDALLLEASQRLLASVRQNDTVARLGGDEFVILLGGLVEGAAARAVAEKMLSAFARPFQVEGHALVVTPSLGVAVYPDDAEDASSLLRNADLAMYEAKDAGRNTYRFFSREVRDRAAQRLAIEGQLRLALERGELWLALQPLVRTADDSVCGAEALLRWRHDGESIGPDRFIPVAEQTGLIVPIGRWVIEQACEQLARWRAAGHPDMHLAVNVSPVQFRDPELVPFIRSTLQRHEVPARCLQVEVTEGLLIHDSPEVRAALLQLSELGVRLALDDFGTGYSSLSYLKHYPFSVLKIDRAFVRELDHNRADRALLSAAIHMGRGLGLAVVAEGVETEAQREVLRQQGCEFMQGYLLGRPVDALSFARHWLSTTATAPAPA